MSEEKFDVVVVGGGPSGLSAAYFLSKKGFNVVVLEKGSTPGSKNVFGGRIYSHVFDKYFPPSWRDEAPVERWVRRERFSMLCENDAVTLEYWSSTAPGKYDSFTAFLSKLLEWMGSLVESEGGLVATGVKVDKLLLEGNVVIGVEAGEENLEADYVLIAEGVNTLLLEQHGLREKPRLETTALGVKEVLRLGRNTINDRFGLRDDEGVAHLFLGGPLAGIRGGGFLYTMGEYVSLGAVVRLSDIGEKKPSMADIAEELRLHPFIKKLVEGGVPVEYSAHLVREGGLGDVMEKPYGPGYMVLGDAAGYLLNTGFSIRGVDLAVETGRLAAEAVEKCRNNGGGPECTKIYGDLLRDSLARRVMEKFRSISGFMDLERLYSSYPKVACRTLRGIYTTDEEPLRLWEALSKAREGEISLITMLLDAVKGVRSL